MNKSLYTILICEDDAMLATMYAEQLRAEGYTVSEVHSGELVIPAIHEHEPDLIVLDMILPKKMGFEILRDLQQETDKKFQGIPVVLLSNLYQQEVIDIATSLGAVEYLVKSRITPKELGEKISTHLPEKE